jgi:tape measure domain-containing protein
MALADLNVRLGLITKSFERSLNDVDRKLRRFQRNIEGIGQDLTNSITVPLAGLGAASLASFAEFEKGAKALEAVTKDAKPVAEQLEALREAAKLPGLGFQEAVQGSARLQAVGLSADEAARTLTEFGNAVARSGGGRAELEGALLALTQIASKGKISAEEINQLNERIFEIRPALEAAFGTSNSEELQALGISSEEFISKVTAEFAKLERVQGGLANSFENFGDSVRTNLARVGDIINKSFDIGGIIDRFDRALTSVVDTFSNLDAGTQRTIVRVAAFAAAIGPALLGIGKIINLGRSAISSLQLLTDGFKALAGGAINAATNVKKLNFGAILTPQVIALTAAVGAAVLIWKEFNRRVELANAAQNAVRDVTLQAEQALAAEEVKVGRLIDTIKDETAAREDKQRALTRLQEISPQYFGTLDLEKSKVEDITAAYEDYRKSVLLQAQAQAAVNKLTELATQRIEKLQEAEDLRASLAEQTGGKLEAAFSIATGSITRTAAQLRRVEQELGSIEKQNGALIDVLKEAETGLDNLGGNDGPKKLADNTTKEFQRISKEAQKIPEEIAKIRAELAAIDTKESILGGSFAEDSERLSTLEKGIESLIDLGAGQENEFLKSLSNQLETIRQQTTLIDFDTSILDRDINAQIDADIGTVSPISIPGITEAEAAIFAYQNRLREATEQADAFGTEAGDVLGEKINITRNALSQAVTDFGANSEAVAILREQYAALNAELDASNEKQERQRQALQAANALAGTLGAGITEFFTALEQGSKNAFQSFIDGFKKAIAELLKRLALALIQAIAVAAVLSLIFPGSAQGGASFAKNLKNVLGGGIPGLAEGGIVPPGYPNDTFPARLSSGEAVIPLDRLSSIIGDQGQQVFIPDLRISGEDLVIVFNKAQNNFNRYS